MSGIGSIGSRLVDVAGTMNADSVDADSRVAPDGGDRRSSGTGAPPVLKEIFSRLGVFVPPLPQPKANPESVGRLKAMLDSNQPVDFALLLVVFQQEQEKVDQAQQKSKIDELENNKTAIKNTVDRDLKKIDEAAKKLEASKKWGIFGKILRAFVVAFTAIAAVATGGALAIAVAVVGAAFTVLDETGAMKKMFDAMGLSADSQKWIMVGISAVLLVAGLGAAGMAVKAATSAASAAAGAGAAIIASVVLRQIAAGAQIAGGVAKVGEGATQVGSAVNQYQIAEIESDRKTIEITNLQLKKQQDDLIQRLQELLQKMEESVQAVVQMVSGEADSFAQIEQNMRALKT
jgi:hypothetical protein